MAKTPTEELEACWKRKLDVLSEWDTTANLQQDRVHKDEEIPTVRAVQRATWLAQWLFGMGVFVDLMSQDRMAGIKFERWAERKEWRVMPDGACDMLVPEGPEIRRVRIGGPLP